MSDDTNIEKAIEQVNDVLAGDLRAPHVKAFFHEPTFTATYVVSDDQTKRAAIIDSVWDFDQPSGRTSLEAADEIIDYARDAGLTVDWVLETHAHADHLSAAPYLQEKLGGELAIGREIVTVQGVFGKVFNEGTDFERDGSQFDRLMEDGDALMIGDIPLIALHVPRPYPSGHGLYHRRCGLYRRYDVHARLWLRPGRFSGRQCAQAVPLGPPADAPAGQDAGVPVP